MQGPRSSGPTPTDPAGATRAWRPSLGYLGVALTIVAGGLALMLTTSSKSPAPVALDSTARATPAVATNSSAPAAPVHAAIAASHSSSLALAPAMTVASSPAAAPAQHIARTRDPNGDLTPDLSDYVNEGEKPTMGEVIDRLHQAGVYGGLGTFSPPGTRPPLVGLAVPEDFVLPEGYVRHYQATDDGQRIEPILMFSPDHPLFDAAGTPIPIPKDRVVPPELAPPGMPIRRIVIPAPAEPGK